MTCRRCHAPIDERYRFDTCSRCSIESVNEACEEWQEAKKVAAYERIRAMRERQEVERE